MIALVLVQSVHAAASNIALRIDSEGHCAIKRMWGETWIMYPDDVRDVLHMQD